MISSVNDFELATVTVDIDIIDDCAVDDPERKHLLGLIRASAGRPRPIGSAAVNKTSNWSPMMYPDLSQLDHLSLPQKLKLVESLWDQIAESQETLPVPEWQKEELDRRHERYKSNPSSGVPWDEAKRRIRGGDA
jgi:putative addiction module component (TIGR02574 family)